KLMRQKTVACQQRGQTREIGVASLRRECQDAQCRDLKDRKKESQWTIKDSGCNQSNYRRVAIRTGLDRRSHRQNGNAKEQRPQNSSHPGKCNRCIVRLRFEKSWYTIENGFHSGNSGTSRRKSAKYKEERKWFNRLNGSKMPNQGLMMDEEGFDDSYHN